MQQVLPGHVCRRRWLLQLSQLTLVTPGLFSRAALAEAGEPVNEHLNFGFNLIRLILISEGKHESMA